MAGRSSGNVEGLALSLVWEIGKCLLGRDQVFVAERGMSLALLRERLSFYSLEWAVFYLTLWVQALD